MPAGTKGVTSASACQGGCHGDRREGAGEDGAGALRTAGGRTLGGHFGKLFLTN